MVCKTHYTVSVPAIFLPNKCSTLVSASCGIFVFGLTGACSVLIGVS